MSNPNTITLPAKARIERGIVYVIDGKEAFSVDVDFDLSRVPPKWHANVLDFLMKEGRKMVVVHPDVARLVEGGAPAEIEIARRQSFFSTLRDFFGL